MAKLLCGRRTDTPCPSGPEPRRFWLFVLSWNILLLKVFAVQDPIRIAGFTPPPEQPQVNCGDTGEGGRRGFSLASLDSGSIFKTRILYRKALLPTKYFLYHFIAAGVDERKIAPRQEQRQKAHAGFGMGAKKSSPWLRSIPARHGLLHDAFNPRAPCRRGGAERNFTGFAVLSGTPFPMKRKSSSHNGIFDEYDQNR